MTDPKQSDKDEPAWAQALKHELTEASKGEENTWGFVAMFMEMIDKVAATAPELTDSKTPRTERLYSGIRERWRLRGFPVPEDINDAQVHAERLEREAEVWRFERDQARAQKEAVMQYLTGIFALIDPPDSQANGKTMRFVNPIAAEVLHELSERIRAIPEEMRTALSAKQDRKEPRVCSECNLEMYEWPTDCCIGTCPHRPVFRSAITERSK